MVTLLLATAALFCEEARSPGTCTTWGVQFMLEDMRKNPGHELGFYAENMAESLPDFFFD